MGLDALKRIRHGLNTDEAQVTRDLPTVFRLHPCFIRVTTQQFLCGMS